MQHHTATDQPTPATSILPTPPAHTPLPSAALWASAFVLFAIVLMQADRLGPAIPSAYADLVSQSGDFTVLTFDGGNDDVLAVLNARSEELFVYRTNQKDEIELKGRLPINEMFELARKNSGRKPKTP